MKWDLEYELKGIVEFLSKWSENLDIADLDCWAYVLLAVCLGLLFYFWKPRKR